MISHESCRWETKVVRGPEDETDPTTHSHRIPIYQTSTFVFESAEQGGRIFSGEEKGYIYTRIKNPTLEFLARKLAYLENAEQGIVFSSGMTAVLSTILSLVNSEETVVASEPLYGGTYDLFKRLEQRFKIRFKYLKCDRFHEQLLDLSANPPALVYIETPANPTLDIIDIEEAAKVTRSWTIPLVVDNTFATPVHQRPIELGANLVIHSLTKYLNGHGDVIGGAVVGDRPIVERISENHTQFGGVISPHDAYLVLRGLKTLHLRMLKHSENAMKVARFLESHPKIERVFYPGLESHPQHNIAKKQMQKGYSGMLSFILKGGRDAGIKLMNSLKVWILAVSLGDTDSLIEHPASMTHSSFTTEELIQAGIPEGLVRLSVGIEDAQDLIDDLNEALNML